jgi:hypothetical protein
LLHGAFQNLRDAKIAQFYHAFVGGQENVFSFDVSVYDFAVVDVLERQGELHENIQNVIFIEQSATLRLDQTEQVSAIAVPSTHGEGA